jgi:hypothetical protein
MDDLPEILLPKPQAALVLSVAIEPGRVYVLDFPLETLQCDVQEQSLRFLFDDGAVLLLQGFFVAAAAENLFLRLEDGTLLQALDMARIFLLDPQKFVCDLDLGFLAGEENLSSVLEALPPGPDPPASPEPLPVVSGASPPALSGTWPVSAPTLEEEARAAEQYLLPFFS